MTERVGASPANANAIERAVIMHVHREVPEKLARERVQVVPRDFIAYREALDLPSLGDHRIRYEKSGSIFIDRYSRYGIKVEMPRLGNSDLRFDSVEVVDRKWPETGDIENSIRYSKHIADEYDRKNGQEALQIVGIQKIIKHVSKDLQVKKEERLSWDELQARVLLGIDSLGFNDSEDERKINLRDAVVEAIKKDRKGRENPARTRILLAHLYPSVTRMMLQNEIKFNKYRYLESVLYGERAKDRAPFEEFVANVRQLEKMSPRNTEADRFKRKIRQLAHTSLSPKKIRVAPYVQVAAVSRYLLFGSNTKEEAGKLAGYIGEEYAQETVEVPSYYEFKEHKDQLKRLSAVADFVESSLEEAESNLPVYELVA